MSYITFYEYILNFIIFVIPIVLIIYSRVDSIYKPSLTLEFIIFDCQISQLIIDLANIINTI